MRITILHGLSYFNIGDLGINFAMINNIKKNYPYAKITIISPYLKNKRPRQKIVRNFIQKNNLIELPAVIQTPQIGAINHIKSLILFFYCCLWAISPFKTKTIKAIPKYLRKTLLNYLDSEIIISKGGCFLLDKGSGPIINSDYLAILFAVILRKKVMLYAQSIGPFKRKISFYLHKWLLNKVNLISAREEDSYKLLKSMKLRKTIVKFTADDVFTLNPIKDNKNTLKCLKKESIINTPKPWIGISVRHWPFPFSKNPKNKKKDFIESIVKLINYITLEQKGSVVLFPNVLLESVDFSGVDDLKLSEIIKTKCLYQDRILIIRGEYDPYEYMEIIRKMNFFVGTRFHSTIFAMIVKVPVMAISYIHKVSGTMKMIGLNEQVYDINCINPETLIDKYKLNFKNRGKIKRTISNNLGRIKDKAGENIDLLEELLKIN